MGLPLAQHLLQLGFTVKGSTTTYAKLEVLRQVGILPYLIHCHPDIKGKDVAEFFASDVLFLNIPFRRSLENPAFYKEQIQSVVRHVERSTVDFVIFASSTSVYPETDGWVTEDQDIRPADPRGRVLWETENLLRENPQFATTILRFAGLYGGERKIGNFLSGQSEVAEADSPVNLVHRDDCLAIVSQIIQQNIRAEIFNVCSDGHPKRKELYTRAALHLGATSPTFAASQGTRLKKVSNQKLKEKLCYQFLHPDPLQ